MNIRTIEHHGDASRGHVGGRRAASPPHGSQPRKATAKGLHPLPRNAHGAAATANDSNPERLADPHGLDAHPRDGRRELPDQLERRRDGTRLSSRHLEEEDVDEVLNDESRRARQRIVALDILSLRHGKVVDVQAGVNHRPKPSQRDHHLPQEHAKLGGSRA